MSWEPGVSQTRENKCCFSVFRTHAPAQMLSCTDASAFVGTCSACACSEPPQPSRRERRDGGHTFGGGLLDGVQGGGRGPLRRRLAVPPQRLLPPRHPPHLRRRRSSSSATHQPIMLPLIRRDTAAYNSVPVHLRRKPARGAVFPVHSTTLQGTEPISSLKTPLVSQSFQRGAGPDIKQLPFEWHPEGSHVSGDSPAGPAACWRWWPGPGRPGCHRG